MLGRSVSCAASSGGGWDPNVEPDPRPEDLYREDDEGAAEGSDFDPNWDRPAWDKRRSRRAGTRRTEPVFPRQAKGRKALPAPLAFVVRVAQRANQVPIVRAGVSVVTQGLVFVVGSAVLMGTVLAYFPTDAYQMELIEPDEQDIQLIAKDEKPAVQPVVVGQNPLRPGVLSDVVPRGEELTRTLAVATSRLPKDMTAGMLLLDLDHGAFAEYNSDEIFSAASMIKLPVLIAFLQDVDQGKIGLNEPIVMRPDLIAGESGGLQYQKPGTSFEALELAYQMIAVSDNTATNMLIDRCGGISAVNERFQAWGITDTILRAQLPDLEGTNSTTPKDMVYLLSLVDSGHVLSMKSRDRAMDILGSTLNDTMLPAAVPGGAKVFHKTGDIGFAVGDVGVVATDKGGRFAAAVIVRRPFNDQRAVEYVREVVRQFYSDLVVRH